jgi:DNA-binding response OmpR family regulator
VLVLSARDTVPEIVRALDNGADDYLTKPFHLDLFLARVRSVSRRGAAPQTLILKKGPIMLDPTQHQVCVGERPVELTRREFMLLETLMRRAGQVVTRDQLAEAVWGYDAEVSKGNLDYHIHSLRAKLGPACEGMVRTMRGTGYMLSGEGVRA